MTVTGEPASGKILLKSACVEGTENDAVEMLDRHTPSEIGGRDDMDKGEISP